MYKPTFYITMEADPARFTPEGQGLASRLWSFTAPVDMKPSLTQELGVLLRMKCTGRPYWNAADAAQQKNWEAVARPALANKLHSVADVLRGCNEKRYQHYEGDIHHVWLKLQLAPYQLRIRLDADAAGNEYIPDALALVDAVRALANSPEVQAFAEGEEQLAVYLPSRTEVEALAATRAAEAEAWAAWETAAKAAEEEALGEAGGDAGDAGNGCAPADAAGESAGQAPLPAKPALAPGLSITTAEFVKPSGEGLVLPLP